MKVEDFLDELIDSVSSDPWEPTDTGFQCVTRNWIVKLRQDSNLPIELLVESYDGKPILHATQQRGNRASNDATTLKLSHLLVQVEKKPIDRIAQLDDVVRELRSGRDSKAR
jgi:hypothetical protein